MTFAFVDFFWLCTLIAIMIFRCCAVLNASKQFSDVVIFQSQLKAAEPYLLFLSFSNESYQAVLPFSAVYYPAQSEILNILP